MKKTLSCDTIKYIAIMAMLLDHIAWAFLQFDSPTAQVFHFIGRITAPTMCFFIVQGFLHTRDVKKYLLRLLVFALISQYPWCMLFKREFTEIPLNIFFTLFFALLAVWAEAEIKNPLLRNIAVFLCTVLTIVSDWCFFAVLWCVVFYRYRNNQRKMWLFFSLVSLSYTVYVLFGSAETVAELYKTIPCCLYSLGSFLCIPLISSYNESIKPSRKNRHVFYLFYPLHMLILAIIENMV